MESIERQVRMRTLLLLFIANCYCVTETDKKGVVTLAKLVKGSNSW